MDTKVCRDCKRSLPMSEYSIGKSRGKDQVQSYCKKCCSLRARFSKLGITTEQVEAQRQKQDNRCAICGIHADEIIHGSYRHNPLVVDHDHLTGVFRGLLCPTCNVMLGHAKDSPLILSRALTYLETCRLV
jgi:hypothetical protein